MRWGYCSLLSCPSTPIPKMHQSQSPRSKELVRVSEEHHKSGRRAGLHEGYCRTRTGLEWAILELVGLL